MKILFVSHQASFIFGGEVVTLEMMRGLRSAGVAVEFASPDGPYHDRAKAITKTHLLPAREFSRNLLQLPGTLVAIWATGIRLRQLVRKEGFTHLHAQSLKAHVFCWWLGVSGFVPVIWHHHDIMPHTVSNMLWLRILSLGAKVIVMPSVATKAALGRAGVVTRKLRVVLNGFPPERWSARGARRDGPFNCLFVGEISERKGADLLAPLAECLGPGFHLTVVGEGLSDPEFARTVRARAATAVEKGLLSFLGRRNDVPEILQSADVLFVPSREDPLPTVIIEAALSGVPAVGFNAGGVSELIEPGVSGFVVQDSREAEEKIRLLCRDRAIWEEMHRACRKLAEEKFSLARVVRQLCEIYSEK